MDNLLTANDLETIARAHRRCGEMEIERTLGALRVRVSTCPASRAWSVPYLIRLERWRPGMYSTQYFDSAEALREEWERGKESYAPQDCGAAWAGGDPMPVRGGVL